MRLSTLKDKTVTVPVKWFDETMNVQVYPGRMNDDTVNRITGFTRKRWTKDSEQTFEDFREESQREEFDAFAYLVADLDIVDDDGEPVPITYELYAALPPRLVSLVIQAVMTGTPEEEGKG